MDEQLDWPRRDAEARTDRGRRRAWGGTALAVAAVIGVAVAAGSARAALADDGPQRVPEPAPAVGVAVADQPTAAPSPTAARVDPYDMDALVTVSAEQVPAEVGRLVPRVEVGPVRRDLGVRDLRQDKVVHFLLDGTLTTVVVERADSIAGCREQARGGPGACELRDGHDLLRWGPTQADGVTARGASYWNHGFVVSVLSYDAPDGKDVAPVAPAPTLTAAELERVATSEVWFTP